MFSPTLFKTSMDRFICQESLETYHQQLAKKTEHLVIAQEAYLEVLDLVNQYNEKIAIAKEQLETLRSELDVSTNDSGNKPALALKIKQYEGFIENAPKKLSPILHRLNQLAEDISALENDIAAIAEQTQRSSNTLSPSAGG